MTEKYKFFKEMEAHLLNDDAPSDYFNRICVAEIFHGDPFSILSRLKEIPQSPKHHPEGNVWNHTMLVVDEAARQKSRSKDPAAFMWAALLHDVGKADTTISSKGRITAYNHERAGAAQAEIFLKDFLDDPALIRRIVSLIRWHMQILFVVKSMQFADIRSMLAEAEPEEVALLGYCDRMGRLGADMRAEKENLKIFLAKCRDFITRS